MTPATPSKNSWSAFEIAHIPIILLASLYGVEYFWKHILRIYYKIQLKICAPNWNGESCLKLNCALFKKNQQPAQNLKSEAREEQRLKKMWVEEKTEDTHV